MAVIFFISFFDFFFLFPGNIVSIMACREVYVRCMKVGRARNESSWTTMASLIGRIGYSHVMKEFSKFQLTSYESK